MEPMNVVYPEAGFLGAVKMVTQAAGALLIFDETITGFRFARGGAQELFGVTPDLSTFGKGIANGFPLSAVVGRREIMMEMEEIFISGTFGGELLSLAAAKIVLLEHLDDAICENLAQIGEKLAAQIDQLIIQYDLKSALTLSGHPTWKFMTWRKSESYSEEQIKTFFMQEAFNSGILVLNSHNVNLAITSKQINRITEVYGNIFGKIQNNIANSNFSNDLKVPPLIPLFKIR